MPVHVPEDPQGVLVNSHAAFEVLAHDALVIQRQLEMMNVFMGFEQANKYVMYATDVSTLSEVADDREALWVSWLKRTRVCWPL